MPIFSENDTVLINGSPVVIKKFIAGGKQGEVHKALNFKTSEYQALKFLYGGYAPDKSKRMFYERTVLLSKVSSAPHPAFAWPNGVGVFDENSLCFSYTMPLKLGFSSSSKLIRYPYSLSIELKAKIAAGILEAFCKLENLNLVYTDVSDKNLLFKITANGDVEVAIIDCENITSEALNLGLQGSGLFRAPEVLLGQLPTASSVVHALSVWVYRLLVAGTHPLNGSNQQNLIFNEDAVIEHYGKNPVFVFSDGGNIPYPSAKKAWDNLPQLMQYYFLYTFSDEVLKGKKPRMNVTYLYNCVKKAYNI